MVQYVPLKRGGLCKIYGISVQLAFMPTVLFFTVCDARYAICMDFYVRFADNCPGNA